MRQAEQKRQNRTIRTGHAEHGRLYGTGRTEHNIYIHQNRIGRTAQEEHDR
jgi:hypothetical protein